LSKKEEERKKKEEEYLNGCPFVWMAVFEEEDA